MNERKKISVLTDNRITRIPNLFFNTLQTKINDSGIATLSSENRPSLPSLIKEIKIVKTLMGNADLVCSSQGFPSISFKIYDSNPSYTLRENEIIQDLLKLPRFFKSSNVVFIISKNSRTNILDYEALIKIQGQIVLQEPFDNVYGGFNFVIASDAIEAAIMVHNLISGYFIEERKNQLALYPTSSSLFYETIKSYNLHHSDWHQENEYDDGILKHFGTEQGRQEQDHAKETFNSGLSAEDIDILVETMGPSLYHLLSSSKEELYEKCPLNLERVNKFLDSFSAMSS